MAAGVTAPCYHTRPESRPSSATPTSAEASTPTAASTSTTSTIPRAPYELWLELGRLLAAWDEMDGVASVLPSPPPSPSPTSPLLSPPETASSSSSLFTPTPCSSSTPSFTSSSPPPPAFSPPPPSYPPTISSSPFAPPLPILGCSFFLCALSGARTDRRMRACPCGVVQYCGRSCQKGDWTEGAHRERCTANRRR
ncbi:hypothetical protein BD626DRAFT_267940 [Schizophyllum amplum]|uniref:MYND-type domain-containing protein n=1 Tax=Schizophyllum amplum TaxID=97359 RepID=A0A550BTY3_9AGAR|nr:hypothetical protein BD626DRAFT_267940 [Auriculariopsis ampla]